jgi:hypothetical protein
MGMDTTVRKMNVVWSHLMIWYLKWAADPYTDTGIFWDVTALRMGMWAEYPKPLIFGRALADGYCQPVGTVYPDELTRGRQGYVVPGSLDATWDGVHKHRPNASELVLFLTDPARRARQAKRYNVTTPCPEGWLDPPPREPESPRAPFRFRFRNSEKK